MTGRGAGRRPGWGVGLAGGGGGALGGGGHGGVGPPPVGGRCPRGGGGGFFPGGWPSPSPLGGGGGGGGAFPARGAPPYLRAPAKEPARSSTSDWRARGSSAMASSVER